MNIIRSTWLIKTKQIAVLLKRTIHLYLTVPSQIKMLSLPSSFKSSVLISGAWNFRRTKIITWYVSSNFQLFILLNVIVHYFACCPVHYKQWGIWMGLYIFTWKGFLAGIFSVLFLISKEYLSLFILRFTQTTFNSTSMPVEGFLFFFPFKCAQYCVLYLH